MLLSWDVRHNEKQQRHRTVFHGIMLHVFVFMHFYKTDFEMTYKYLAFGHDGMIML